MPALPVPQQSDWNNNVYVLATTRIFVIIGMAYLVKILYNMASSMWGARSASIAESEHCFLFIFHQRIGVKSHSLTSLSYRVVIADGIDLEDITSDTPVMSPGAVGTGSDLEANLTLGIRPPQPSYNPHNHFERSRANSRAEYQVTDVSGSPTAAHGLREQDDGVRSSDDYVEQGMDITVDMTG